MNICKSSTLILSTPQFINSFTLLRQIKSSCKIIFIDPQIEDFQSLISGVTPDAIVVVLDATQDGIKQITQCLSRHQLSEIHIVSHGAPGCLYLGAGQLSLDTLNQYAQALNTWSAESIFLYGCNVAAGDAGAEFIEQLHQLTGAEIAASTTKIGHIAKGGNWDLDLKTSEFEAAIAFNTQVQSQWLHVLDPFESQPYFYQVISGQLKILNPLTGDYDDVGAANDSYNATGFNDSDNYIYGVGTSGVNIQKVIQVHADGTIEALELTNTATGAIENLPYSPNAGDIDSANQILWIKNGLISNELIKVDLVKKTFEKISIDDNSGSTDATNVSDFAFVSSGTNGSLYGAKEGRLYVWNLDTNTVINKSVTDLSIQGQFGAAWIDKDNQLYVSNNKSGTIYRIDDFTSSTPTAVEVATGTTTANNDGTSSPGQKSTFDVPFIDPDGDNSGQTAFQYEDTFTEGGSAVGIVEADADDETTDTLLSDFDGDDSPDADESTIKSTTITLTNAQTGDEFEIGSLPSTIDSNLDHTSTPGQIIITLTATDSTNGASPADFELALEAIQFNNTSDDPNTTQRVIEIFLTDTEDNQGNTAKTYINVVPVNDPPVANNNTVSVVEDNTASGNVISDDDGNGIDSDVDGDSLNISEATVDINGDGSNETLTLGTATDITVSGEVIGSLSLDSLGAYSFVPTTNFNGTVPTITYTLSDGNLTDTATLNISVTANNPPVANNNTVSVVEETTASGNVINDDDATDGIDSDVEDDSLNISEATVDIDGDGNVENLTLGTATNITVGGEVIGEITLNTDGTYNWVPTENFNGNVPTITYTLSDGNLTDTATLNISVTAENDPPVANNNTVSVVEETTASGNVINDDDATDGTDSDVEDDSLNISEATVDIDGDGNVENLTLGTATDITVGGEVIGSLTLNTDGSYNFVPTENFNGNVPPITYTLSDGNLTDTATLNISVTADNDPPVANNNSSGVVKDGVTPATGNVIDDNDGDGVDNDVDGDSLSVTNVNSTAVNTTNTEITGSFGTLTINPDGSYEYEVDTNNSTVQALGSGGTLTDTFTYTISDSNGGTDTAELVITVSGSNNTPTATTNSNSVDEDGTTTPSGNIITDDNGDGVDSDPNNDSLTVSEVNNEAISTDTEITGTFGTLTISNDGSYEYNVNETDPNVQALGTNETLTETFTYTINDGKGGTDTAELVITINGINDTSVANNDNKTTPEDTPINIDVVENDTDAEDGTPSGQITITTQPPNGTVEIDDKGTADTSDDEVVYTPNTNFVGTDTFTYTIKDSEGVTSEPATVTVTVEEVNDKPVANNNTTTTKEETPVTIDVVENDTDDEDGTPTGKITIVDEPTNGTVEIDDNGTPDDFSDDQVVYTPDENFTGEETFTYTVTDSEGVTSEPATVSVSVNPINDEPVANDDGVTTDEETSVTVDVSQNDTDVEDGTPTGEITIIDQPTNGTVEIDDNGTPDDPSDDQVIYTPNENFTGTETFTYTIEDSEGNASDPATVTVSVGGVNDQPIANNDAVTTPEDTSVTVNIRENDTDVEDETPTGKITIIDQPENGTIEIDDKGTPDDFSDDEVIYTPNNNYAGEDTFTYTITDSEGLPSNTATVTIGITPPVNDVPVANDEGVVTPEDTPVTIDVVENDTDAEDGTPIGQITIIDQPTNGTVEIDDKGTPNDFSDDEVIYTPNSEFNGTDTFTYTVQDSEGESSDPATVTVDVESINDTPVANNDTATTSENTSVTVDVRNNDTDVEDDVPTGVINIIDQPTNGTVTLDDKGNDDPSDDEVVYTPNEGFVGTDTFTYTIEDSEGQPSSVATVTVTVNETIDETVDETNNPIANNDSAITLANTSTTINLVENDTDDREVIPSSVTIVENPGNGVLTINEDGTVEYTPNSEFTGEETFTYSITDNEGNVSEPATVTIFVQSPSQDTDKDGIPDVDDLDDDNDGIPDAEDGPGDTDGDGIPDSLDLDSDNDGLSDLVESGLTPEKIAELDTDGDGVIDPTNEFGPNGFADVVETSPESGLLDLNGDGTVDKPIDTDGDGVPDSLDLDSDNDGLNDIVEAGDTDGDNVPDFRDLDSDNDGINDIIEGGLTDPDGDGVVNGPDNDGDGILDQADPNDNSFSDNEERLAPDTDGDGTPDYQDLDSDNDGENDIVEAGIADPEGDGVVNGPDNDGDGIPDAVDLNNDGFGDILSDDLPDEDSDGIPDFQDLNTTPVAEDDEVTVPANTALNISVLENDSDSNDDPLSLVEFDATSANGGEIVLDGDTLRYIPAADFTGIDTFTYTISDGQGGTDTATVTVTVTEDVPTAVLIAEPTLLVAEPEPVAEPSPSVVIETPAVNRPPVPVDDNQELTSDRSVTLDVLGNDSDPDGDAFSLHEFDTVSANGGTITLDGDQLVYTPPAGFEGTDSFTYSIIDSQGSTGTATVTLTVEPEGTQPVETTCCGSCPVAPTLEPIVLPEEPIFETSLLSELLNVSNANISASNLDDILEGTNEADLIDGKVGNDRLWGDSENDTLIGGPSGTEPLGNIGEQDTLFGHEGDDWFVGNLGQDILHGGLGNDHSHGGKDDDTVIGEIGNDTLLGEQGNDTILGGTTNATVEDVNGTDLLFGGADDDWLAGNQGNDTLVGGEGNDELHGGKDDDLLYGNTGDDTLAGELGNDTLIAGPSGDEPLGETGDQDVLFGYEANDWLSGNLGRDTLHGGIGNDRAHGGKDNDWVIGEIGNDTLVGEQGDDTLLGGTSNDANDLTRDLNGADLLFGEGGNDWMEGNEGNDTLVGGEGDDIAYGGQNDDLLHGSDGNDYLMGDRGNDTLCGGEGDDTLRGDQIDNGISPAVGVNGQQDNLSGGAGNDLLFGDEGQDTLCGGEGNDTLHGGKDNDLLKGCLGDDLLLGEQGDDTLMGGEGDTTLTGGEGNDSFVLNTSGLDLITDFQVGQDSLVLSEELTLSQLQINQEDNNTIISVDNQLIATLLDVDAAAILDSDSFI